MVDRTTYPKDEVPELLLRQLFGKHNVHEDLCLLMAKHGLRSVEHFAMLGDNLEMAKKTFIAMITDVAKLGATEAAQQTALLYICTVWKFCTALCEHFALRRAKMEERPPPDP